jgi:tRNA(adenine34) deaminase
VIADRDADVDPEADEDAMRLALEEARAAEAHDDVPVGAVVVRDGQVIGRGRNRREADQDPTAHAEVLALRAAAAATGGWHLEGCTLVVTLEPCAMCAGALVLARIDRLVYGAADPKAGAIASALALLDGPGINHRPAVTAGVLAADCGSLLTAFFAARRAGTRPGRRRRESTRTSGDPPTRAPGPNAPT